MNTFIAVIIAIITAFITPPAPSEGGLFIESATLDTSQVTIAVDCWEPPMPDGTIVPCD